MSKQPIQQLTKDAKLVAEYSSMCEAHVKTGIDLANISRASTSEGRIAGGFRWRKVK